MKRALIFAILLACSGTAFAAEPGMTISADGVGNFKVGMPIDALERAVHQKLRYNEYANNGCVLVSTPGWEPWGLGFMIEQRKLTRINVDFYDTDPKPRMIKTAEGIGLGSAEADVVKTYGSRLRTEVNPLDPAWHTLYVDEPDHSRGMIFETDGKTVKSLRVGLYPSITSRTGCP